MTCAHELLHPSYDGPADDASLVGHRALVEQVHRFVDQHLDDPDLSLRAVAAAHYVSVRQLQKTFEPGGVSVSTLVRHRRLERCRRDLADPALSGRPIAAIGARWGLLDAAHFSRLFRRRYGASPRDFRRQQLSPISA